MSKSWRVSALALVAVVAAVVFLLVGVSSKAASRPERTCPVARVFLGHDCVTSTSLSPGSYGPVPSSSSPPRPSSHHAHEPRITDGSLGNQASRVACTLLSSSEIARVFRAPVSRGAPVFPYCEWLVGANMFVALQVEPGVSFNAATQWVATYQTVRGLGSRAIVANNHVLYFTWSGVTYGLSVQTAGNFDPAFDLRQLIVLGHDVLLRGLPRGPVGLGAPVPAGPPIYFAGDSTAAGPQWAWWEYHANTTQTRTLTDYMVGSGFIRYNFFNWPKHIVAVAAAWRPKVVIWMGSANDDQPIVVRGRYAPVGSRLWTAVFARSVAWTMAALQREGCKVLWIGEPAMQDAQLSAAMKLIDRVYAIEARAHPGVVFLNPGTYLDGPGATYTGIVKIGGQETSVFLDGVHLNTAGSVFFAGIIARYVDRLLGLKAG